MFNILIKLFELIITSGIVGSNSFINLISELIEFVEIHKSTRVYIFVSSPVGFGWFILNDGVWYSFIPISSSVAYPTVRPKNLYLPNSSSKNVVLNPNVIFA